MAKLLEQPWHGAGSPRPLKPAGAVSVWATVGAAAWTVEVVALRRPKVAASRTMAKVTAARAFFMTILLKCFFEWPIVRLPQFRPLVVSQESPGRAESAGRFAGKEQQDSRIP